MLKEPNDNASIFKRALPGEFPKSSDNTDTPVLFFDKSLVVSDSPIELFTISELAKILKISVSGVRRLQQGRHLPFVKVGGCIRFFKSDIIAYLDKRRVETIE